MRRLVINPLRIWGFQNEIGASLDLIKLVSKEGWNKIPPVPVFPLPEEFVKDSFHYALIDGNIRRNTAEHLRHEIECAVYKIGEKVDLDKHRLAFFRHHQHLHIYSKILAEYQKRNPSQPQEFT